MCHYYQRGTGRGKLESRGGILGGHTGRLILRREGSEVGAEGIYKRFCACATCAPKIPVFLAESGRN